MSLNSGWSILWPEKPGRYWLYIKGTHPGDKYELMVAQSYSMANKNAYVAKGQIIYKSEWGTPAYWLPIEEPELPEVIE